MINFTHVFLYIFVKMKLAELTHLHDKFITMAMYYTHDIEKAREIVQSMYLRLCEIENNEGSLNRICVSNRPPVEYIFTIIRNLYFNHQKYESRYARNIDPVGRHIDPVEPPFLRDLIKHLPWYDRELTRVYFEKQHSIRSLAKETHISTRNVWETIHRTKLYLIKILTYEQTIIEDRKKRKVGENQIGKTKTEKEIRQKEKTR